MVKLCGCKLVRHEHAAIVATQSQLVCTRCTSQGNQIGVVAINHSNVNTKLLTVLRMIHQFRFTSLEAQ